MPMITRSGGEPETPFVDDCGVLLLVYITPGKQQADDKFGYDFRTNGSLSGGFGLLFKRRSGQTAALFWTWPGVTSKTS